ncbi:ABC transporter transmembrane domain-containing protein, partial [Escherichia coli]|nr:ABC transporter transmembrane domain-containing protein [Escherichia coli]
FKAAKKAQFISGIMMPVMQFVGNLGYVGVCVAGGIFVTNGTLQVGDIQSFTQYVQLFTQPISSVANIANIIQSTIASAERVFEMMDEEEEKDEIPANVNQVAG